MDVDGDGPRFGAIHCADNFSGMPYIMHLMNVYDLTHAMLTSVAAFRYPGAPQRDQPRSTRHLLLGPCRTTRLQADLRQHHARREYHAVRDSVCGACRLGFMSVHV